jgi:protein-S-isoprenylcysteine O-methyltransferase Ste14
MDLYYKIIFGGLLLGFIGIRGIFGLIAQRSGLSANFVYGEQKTQDEKKLGVIGVLVILVFLAILAVYIVFPGEGDILIILLPEWIHYIGIGIGIISLGFQIIVHRTLQNSWSYAKANHKDNFIIQRGPYKWIRHPLYFSLILFMIGLALVTAYIPFMILAIVCIPFFNNESKKEEIEMRKRCGEDYENYCKNTGRLLPKFNVNRVRE